MVRSEVASQTRPKRSPKPRSRVGGAAVRGSIAVGPTVRKRGSPQLCSAGCLFCWGCNLWPATRIWGQRICKEYFFSNAFPHASSRFLKIRRFISGAQCGNRAVQKVSPRPLTLFCGTYRIQWLYAVGCGELRGKMGQKRPIFGLLMQRTKNLSAARLFWPRSGRGAKRRNGRWFCVR